MTRYRLLIDIEVAIDDLEFKAAALTTPPAGVDDVDVQGVRDAITRLLVGCAWHEIGAVPLRSLVTPRVCDADGWYDSLFVAGDRGVGETTPTGAER